MRAKKHLGQNFLKSESTLNKIIETAELSPKDHIIEIGPGLGILTIELAKKAKKVTTIELDKDLIPILEKTLTNYKNIKIIHGDALKFIPPKTKYKIAANIPYYITSPLLNHFLQAKNKPTTITLLVQKEVAEKIIQLEPKMSILSLQVALFGKARLIKKIPKTAFHPQPKVDSAILHIKLHQKSNTKEALHILTLAKIAFSQKRKKLRNTLFKQLKITPKISPDRRPETLSVQEWRKLTKSLK